MMLARLRRVRRIWGIAALACTSVAALGARGASVGGEWRIHQQVVATGDMMTVARSAVVEVARPAGAQDRSVVGVFVAPHDALAAIHAVARRQPINSASVSGLVTPRPRRLAFKYEANAPPTAL
jgi:hypothetical protein